MPVSDQQKLQDLLQKADDAPLWRALQPLRSVLSFMNTGAHPDDETTRMLAALSLRDGVKISQACANRGEGGQNTIGHEAGAELGALRTLEMERAAKVINMSHYWLSQSPEDTIFDFGFSKSGDETLQKWGEARTLERFVEIIRTERPDIICPTFLDIPGQHGHHRAMTRAAFKAVILAADASYLPENGPEIWQVKKLYLPAWSGAGDAYDDDVPPPPQTVMLDASGADPVLAADYAQIAEVSRSFHKTQGMGAWVETGAKSHWPLHLAWQYDGKTGPESSIFEGLPKTLDDLAGFANTPQLSGPLQRAQQAIDKAIQAWPNKDELRANALKALSYLNIALALCPPLGRAEVVHRLNAKIAQISRVIWLARRQNAQPTLTPSRIYPGEVLTLEIEDLPDDIIAQPIVPKGWAYTEVARGAFEISVPNSAPASNPYPDIWRPEVANSCPHLKLSWQEGDTSVEVTVDPAQKPIIQPAISANLSQSAAILNLKNPKPVSIQVSDIHPVGAMPELPPQKGWDVSKRDNTFTLTPNGEIRSGNFRFALMLDGKAAQTCKTIGYAHTGKAQLCKPAGISVQVVDIALPDGNIAYIGGGNDTVDHWLQKLGVNVVTLQDDDIAKADLAEFDTILIGVFAMRTCKNLAARMADIHAWVRQGGNLVTLYHRPWDNWDIEKTPLASLTIGKPSLRWRVTDENAVVTHLQPDHVLLNTPNVVSGADWQGWFKERGLYFAASWAAAYTPLLSMADAGEAPLEGALVSGKFGKGRHTHTSLALHIQAQNLVPGGLKLLANLLHNPRST